MVRSKPPRFPTPADQNPMSIAAHAKEIAAARGYDIAKSGAMYGDYVVTEDIWRKVEDSYPDFGFRFIHDAEYPSTGPPSWSPYIKALKDAGVEVVYFTGSCPFHYQAVREEAALQEFDAMWLLDTNFYDAACSTVNDYRTMDNSFIRMVFVPFEEASTNKATQDFIDVLDEDYNNQLTLLGNGGCIQLLAVGYRCGCLRL